MTVYMNLRLWTLTAVHRNHVCEEQLRRRPPYEAVHLNPLGAGSVAFNRIFSELDPTNTNFSLPQISQF